MIVCAKLPDKMSDLLERALADLEAVEADPRYSVDMDSWHATGFSYDENPRPVCFVCLAGATLRNVLSPDSNIVFGNLDDDTNMKLGALNSLRRGELACAYFDLARTMPDRLEPYIPNVAHYGNEPERFKADMRRLIAYLREYNE